MSEIKPVAWRLDLDPPRGNWTYVDRTANPWPGSPHAQALYTHDALDAAREEGRRQLQVECERLRDKALRFDLYRAGIERAELEAVELVELRAECERLREAHAKLVAEISLPTATVSAMRGWVADEWRIELDRLRAELAAMRKAASALTEIVRMPNAEHIADAHNAAVRLLKETHDE